jgi:hypothetical protein
MKNIINQLHKVKAIELSLTLVALWWSIVLGLPYDTFSSSMDYDAMAGMASEGVWSLYFLCLGLVQSYGMFNENIVLLYKKVNTKRLALLVSTGAWFFVASMFAIGNIATTATGVYFILGCLSAWLYVKVGGNNGI